jgi:hypothetical protein
LRRIFLIHEKILEDLRKSLQIGDCNLNPSPSEVRTSSRVFFDVRQSRF